MAVCTYNAKLEQLEIHGAGLILTIPAAPWQVHRIGEFAAALSKTPMQSAEVEVRLTAGSLVLLQYVPAEKTFQVTTTSDRVSHVSQHIVESLDSFLQSLNMAVAEAQTVLVARASSSPRPVFELADMCICM